MSIERKGPFCPHCGDELEAKDTKGKRLEKHVSTGLYGCVAPHGSQS
jgi:NADH pyrophosphatase NudC (nudix superfamily)